MPDRRLLVLWDVDHTLIENAGVSKENYALAFELLTGHRPTLAARTDGRTDPEIMRNLLTDNRVDPSVFSEQRVTAALVEAMQRHSARLTERGHMLPGVADTLAMVGKLDAVVQSVLTGNIAPNAAAKLRLLGDVTSLLDLEVGGYGSDDVVRSRLVPAAQAKATAKYGYRFDRADTVLIGDTERDVEAALNGGALVIGVATGPSSEAELVAAGAHATVPDLTEAQAVVATLAAVTGMDFDAPAA
ncbi:MAG: HAD family hydrolase [Micromonosporaceae bacterium]